MEVHVLQISMLPGFDNNMPEYPMNAKDCFRAYDLYHHCDVTK